MTEERHPTWVKAFAAAHFRWQAMKSTIIWKHEMSPLLLLRNNFRVKSTLLVICLMHAQANNSLKEWHLNPFLPVSMVRVRWEIGVASRGTTRIWGFLVQLKSTALVVMIGQVTAPDSCIPWWRNIEVAASTARGRRWDLCHASFVFSCCHYNHAIKQQCHD